MKLFNPRIKSGCLIVCLTLSLQRCGTTTGNAFDGSDVSVTFKSFSNAVSIRGVSPNSISSITMCFKRLRFKPEGKTTDLDPSQDSDNLDFAIGEITLSPGGTELGSLRVPKGEYRRIEFDLEDKCASGKSLQLTVDGQSYSTRDRITFRFKGSFVLGDETKVLSLGVQSIIAALRTTGKDDDIKKHAESADGDF